METPVDPEAPEQEAPDPEAAEAQAARRGVDPWLRFTALFATLAIATEILYYAVILGSEGLDAYLNVLAIVTGFILNVLGQNVEVVGSSIWNGAFMIDVAPECDAVQLCTLFGSAIIAFPAQLSSKLIGLGAGLAWLQTVNFARIASLYFIGSHFAESTFHTAHEVVWPVVLIALTVFAWIVWARRLGDPLEAA